MTEVLLVCSDEGVFKSVKATGHAGYSAKGTDIVCAAVTILLRTTLEVLESTEGISLETETSLRGTLAFRVIDIKSQKLDEAGTDSLSDNLKNRLVCTADFLRTGIQSLCEEFPKNVQLREIID